MTCFQEQPLATHIQTFYGPRPLVPSSTSGEIFDGANPWSMQFVVYGRGSQLRAVWSLKNIWQCLEKFGVVTLGRRGATACNG